MMSQAVDINSNDPKPTQRQIPQHLGYSDSIAKRYREHRNIARPHNGENTEKIKRGFQDIFITSSNVED